jgi:hypothetical protein
MAAKGSLIKTRLNNHKLRRKCYEKAVNVDVAAVLGNIFGERQTLAKDVPITVSDGAGGTQELRFGLAPDATAGIDTALPDCWSCVSSLACRNSSNVSGYM